MTYGERIQRHLVHQGIGTTLMFMALCAGMSAKALERYLSRRLNAGLIEAYRLVGPTKYYVLSAKGARSLGAPDEGAGMGYGYQALLQNYAMAASCAMLPLPKERLTRAELLARVPFVSKSVVGHFRSRYFFDRSDSQEGIVRIGYFVVDLGKDLPTLTRKVRREVDKRRQNAFAELIRQRLFSVCVLTATDATAEQIRHSLADLPVPLRVEVIPGYSQLLIRKG